MLRVKLVSSKTKLLGYATPSKKHLLELAKIVNPVTIPVCHVLISGKSSACSWFQQIRFLCLLQEWFLAVLGQNT